MAWNEIIDNALKTIDIGTDLISKNDTVEEKVEVCDEDMGYINWMIDKMDLDVDMKYTLDKIMGHI